MPRWWTSVLAPRSLMSSKVNFENQILMSPSLPSMKLYTYYRSTAAFRVRIALNIKGVAFESISKHLRNAEHRASEYTRLNPQGLIPALEDGGEVISQSIAITEYLDEKYPRPPLLPTDPLARAHVRSIALAVACDMHP